MLRAMLSSVPVLVLCAAGLPAADDKPDRKDDSANGVVVKVDAQNHEITLRLTADGKEVEKTFTLGDGVRLTDESGQASDLASLKPGDAVAFTAKDGRLAELRRARREERRAFDVDRFLERYDKNKDGYIERDELPERFQDAFDKIDTDKDGKLSREELEKGAAYLQRRRRPADFVNVLVEMSDCDEDCVQELQLVYDVLRKMDKNHDGKLDAEELKAAREQVVADRVDEILKDLDADNDGKISRDEARGWVKRDFDKIDLNKDGFIDRDELMKAASEAPPPPGKEKEAPAPPKNPSDR